MWQDPQGSVDAIDLPNVNLLIEIPTVKSRRPHRDNNSVTTFEELFRFPSTDNKRSTIATVYAEIKLRIRSFIRATKRENSEASIASILSIAIVY